MESKSIVLFDGVCNFCNGTVRFIIERDPDARFAFAPLQSEVGRELLAKNGYEAAIDPDTVLLVENGAVYERSTAALRIARHLRGPTKLLHAFVIVPRFLRDAVYRLIARNRYRWFGKSEQCIVPSPSVRSRFLAQSS
jgi:predicted DCC family thiol-disulfide oxidoreductase YuxK